MKPSYSFSQVIEFIRHSETCEDVKNIAAVFYDERERYSGFHGLLIDHALNIAHYLLQVQEYQNREHDL